MPAQEKALATTASPDLAALLDLSVPTLDRYADRQGYELIVDRPPADEVDADDPYWRKVELLREYLPKYPGGVVLLDADVMVVDNERDIAKDVKAGAAGAFQGLAMEQGHWGVAPNTGVWPMRHEDESFEFLDALEAYSRPQEAGSPQVAVRLALGYEIQEHIGYKKVKEGGAEITRPAHPSKFLERTGLLPREWNPVGDAWEAIVKQGRLAYALHIWGREPDRKIELMTKITELQHRHRHPADIMIDFARYLIESPGPHPKRPGPSNETI